MAVTIKNPVCIQSGGFAKGMYQTCSVPSNGVLATSSAQTFSIITRLYKYESYSNGLLKCSANDSYGIYVQDFASVDLGYLDSSGVFHTIGSGSRSTATIDFTINSGVSFNNYTFLFMKDNSTGDIYLVCSYITSGRSHSLSTTSSSSTPNSIGRIYQYSSLSATIPSGSCTNVTISYPVYTLSSGSLSSESAERLGIFIY